MRKRLARRDRVRLDRVREEFKKWRAGREGREPVPSALWRAAAGLVGPVPITTVVRELGLQFSQLKRQVEHFAVRPRPSRRKKVRTPAFVELTGSPPAPRRVTGSSALAGAAVEFERSDGTRLRLSGDALRGLDLGALVIRFSATGERG